MTIREFDAVVADLRKKSIDPETLYGNSAGVSSKSPGDISLRCVGKGKTVRIGTITVGSLDGNAEPTTYVDESLVGNSIGLKNGGLPYYRDEEVGAELVRAIHAVGKRAVLSILGETPEQIIELLLFALAIGVDEVEINISCPNKWSRSTSRQEPMICYVPRDVNTVVATIDESLAGKFAPGDVSIRLKLGPYTDFVQLEEVLNVIAPSRYVTGITMSNTISRGLIFGDDNKLVIPRPVGLSASNLFRAMMLGQVEFARDILPEDKGISAVGGLYKAEHIIHCLMCGAEEAQIGGAMLRWPNILGVITDDLQRIIYPSD